MNSVKIFQQKNNTLLIIYDLSFVEKRKKIHLIFLPTSLYSITYKMLYELHMWELKTKKIVLRNVNLVMFNR